MDGLRRSKRRRYSPLAYWRLEKVVYGRPGSGPCLVPSIREIHRIPEVKSEPLGAKRRKGGVRKKSSRNSATAEPEPEPEQVLVYDPEEGWDDETDPHCTVLEYGEYGQEVERREWLAVGIRVVPRLSEHSSNRALVQVSRSPPRWLRRSRQRRARSSSRRSLATGITSPPVSSSFRRTRPNRRRARRIILLYVLRAHPWPRYPSYAYPSILL